MSLVAHGLGLSIGGVPILQDVSLSVAPGRVHAILGPNGAGKSTLLRLLAGERRSGAGRIELNGQPLANWTAAETARQRAVLPQSEGLRFGFKVEEVVALGRLPCPRHAPAREAALVKAALEATDAAHLIGRRYLTLSGGERQRVQLARVLAQIWEPLDRLDRFLLLDEPTAALDLAHQHACLAVARRFAAQGVGVLAVLHDPNLALAYADEVTLLDLGRVAASGAAADVLTEGWVSKVFGVQVRAVEFEGRRHLAVAGPASLGT